MNRSIAADLYFHTVQFSGNVCLFPEIILSGKTCMNHGIIHWRTNSLMNFMNSFSFLLKTHPKDCSTVSRVFKEVKQLVPRSLLKVQLHWEHFWKISFKENCRNEPKIQEVKNHAVSFLEIVKKKNVLQRTNLSLIVTRVDIFPSKSPPFCIFLHFSQLSVDSSIGNYSAKDSFLSEILEVFSTL